MERLEEQLRIRTPICLGLKRAVISSAHFCELSFWREVDDHFLAAAPDRIITNELEVSRKTTSDLTSQRSMGRSGLPDTGAQTIDEGLLRPLVGPGLGGPYLAQPTSPASNRWAEGHEELAPSIVWTRTQSKRGQIQARTRS